MLYTLSFLFVDLATALDPKVRDKLTHRIASELNLNTLSA